MRCYAEENILTLEEYMLPLVRISSIFQWANTKPHKNRLHAEDIARLLVS